jgi:hypothetical protein
MHAGDTILTFLTERLGSDSVDNIARPTRQQKGFIQRVKKEAFLLLGETTNLEAVCEYIADNPQEACQ